MDINAKILQNSLFKAIGNGDQLNELKKIKESAERLMLKSLSEEGQEVARNTIILVNEIILNHRINDSQDPEKNIYHEILSISQIYHSSAKPTLNEKTLEALNPEYERIEVLVNKSGVFNSDEKRELRGIIEDFQVLGLERATKNQNEYQRVVKALENIHPVARMISTTGDGNCLYNAISTEDHILAGDYSPDDLGEENQARLRKLTTEYMKEHHEDLGINKDAYKEHEIDRTWGTDDQIRCLVGAEEKPILILRKHPLNPDELQGTIYHKKGNEEINPNELRVIVNLELVHFNAIFTNQEVRQALLEKYQVMTVPVL